MVAMKEGFLGAFLDLDALELLLLAEDSFPFIDRRQRRREKTTRERSSVRPEEILSLLLGGTLMLYLNNMPAVHQCIATSASVWSARASAGGVIHTHDPKP